jgi:hypothetical protein
VPLVGKGVPLCRAYDPSATLSVYSALLAKQRGCDVTIRCCYVNEIVKSAGRAARGLFVAWCAAHADSQPATVHVRKKIKEKEPTCGTTVRGLLSLRWEPNVTISQRSSISI